MYFEKPLISIIIPVYNEEQNIPLLYSALLKTWIHLKEKYSYEFIFINDGSKDSSEIIIKNLIQYDHQVKYITFSRNFGKELAITAGLQYAQGEAAIILDGDLQHPPELIPKFIQKWEAGSDIVIGIRKKNATTSFLKKLGSFLFYKIMNSISETKIIPQATDYRLISQQVIQEFNRFTERGRMARGLIDWLGFKKDFISFEAQERKNGKASYSYPKLIKLALSSFIAHSLFPLKLAGYLGIFTTLFSGSLGFFIIVEKYILGDPWQLHFSGPAILAVLILFLVGIILICLGLIAMYIANIHEEVANRPLYVIQKKIL